MLSKSREGERSRENYDYNITKEENWAFKKRPNMENILCKMQNFKRPTKIQILKPILGAKIVRDP